MLWRGYSITLITNNDPNQEPTTSQFILKAI